MPGLLENAEHSQVPWWAWLVASLLICIIVYLSGHLLAVLLLHFLSRSRRFSRSVLAIALSYIVLLPFPNCYPCGSFWVNLHAVHLVERYNQHGWTEDLEKAVMISRAALKHCPEDYPDRPLLLVTLADALIDRFEKRGRIKDLEEAIALHRTILALYPEDHPRRPSSLLRLARALHGQFHQTRRASNIEESITLRRTALTLSPFGHPAHLSALSGLADELASQCILTGRAENLTESIILHRTVLDLCPDCYSFEPSSMTGLADVLNLRFRQTRRTEDNNESIALYRNALALIPEGTPERLDTLRGLARGLQDRFAETRQAGDIDEAVALRRTILELAPEGDIDRFLPLTGLADALSLRDFQSSDIEEPIALYRTALTLCPEGHDYRPAILNGLANALMERFHQTGQIEDIEEAILSRRTSLLIRSGEYPQRSSTLTSLAISLLILFEKRGVDDDYEESIKLLEYASNDKLSSPNDCLEAAHFWAVYALRYNHHTTLKAHRTAASLLQLCITTIPTLRAQLEFLSRNSHYQILPLGAVAYAIEKDELDQALELLEQGRALLWAQLRGFRTPLDRLAETHLVLANGFRDINHRLEVLATTTKALNSDLGMNRANALVPSVHVGRRMFDEILELKRYLSERQEEMINEIRQVPGFEDFLQTTPFKVLKQVALEGPVIVVNHSRFRSDALIILPSKDLPIVNIPLDREFYDDSRKVCKELVETRKRFHAGSTEYDEKLRETVKFSWDRVVSKVVHKLKELGVSKGARIWWCPTSVLTALPFHAAGPFQDEDGTVKYLLDDYISSYTPTLGALINSRSASTSANPEMLIVGDTESLESTRKEIRAVRNCSRSYITSSTILLNKKALRDTVIERLHRSTWLHFACHGHLDLRPFDSSFKLSDGGLTLLDIVRANLPNAEFAFLSACHTAEQPDFGLYDEVLHLSAAVQFCGFRSVIGTMWEMYDLDGPLLAKEVYSYLAQYEDGEAIHKRSAAALRSAVLELRELPDIQIERWVNLVHIGA